MKQFYKNLLSTIQYFGLFLMILEACSLNGLRAQDTTAIKPALVSGFKPVKNTFDGSLLIDNQTCMVPFKNTLEFVIQHRFGLVNNGYKDLYGIFAPANIRLGFNFTPVNNLSVSVGICKEKMQWDCNIKWAIVKQSQRGFPLSITYYGDVAIDTRPKEGNFVTDADRLSYFNQLMIARKITEHLSLQVSPSYTHFNNVDGYINSEGSISPKMKNDHFAIAFMGRLKFSERVGIIADYDQPLTQHPTNNPHPNVSFGIEIGTISHSFQIFVTNYHSIIPQSNNFYNQNDYSKGQFMIGFNITRKWHF